MGEASQVLESIEGELRLIRYRLEAIEEALSEEMTADDVEALKRALEEHRKGKTVSLKEAARRLT